MNFAELDSGRQILSYAVLGVVMAGFLAGTWIFFRRQAEGHHPVYPISWTPGQRRALEWFRIQIGFVLIPLWGVFSLMSPPMVTNWPLGLVPLTSLIAASYGWVVFLTPRDWRFGALHRSFWLTIGFLMVWWVVMLTTTTRVVITASEPVPPVHEVPPIGVIAAGPEQ